jgi:DNA-binding CsgD family transcriptional regulator
LQLGLTVSLRTGEVEGADTVAGMLATDNVRALAPAPLGETGVARAATDVLGRSLPKGCVPVCRELTGGNPLLLRQLLEAVRAEGVDPTSETLRAFGNLAPCSLSRAVMLRVGRLPEQVRRLARVVAVLGDGAALRHVAELADLMPDDVLAGAARLAATGIFSDQRTVAFAHPLIRAGVYSDLSNPERALLHARAARILARDHEAADVAPHLLASEPAGDPWVVDVLREAARQATVRGEAGTAVACMRRALAEPPSTELRADTLAHLGISEARAEQHAAAVPHLREALDQELDPTMRRNAALALAEALVVTDGTLAAVELLGTQRGRLEGDDRLRLELEQVRLASFVPELAADALHKMGEFVALSGTTPGERLALANAAAALGMNPASRAADTSAVAIRSLGHGALVRDPIAPPTAAGTALYFLLFTEDLDAVQRETEHVLEHARAVGSPETLAVAAFTRCDMFRLRGDLLAAVAEGELLLRLLGELPETPMYLRTEAAAVCWMTEIGLLRGDLDGTREMLARSVHDRDLDDPQLALLRHAVGLVALHEGRLEQARQDLERVGTVAKAAGYEDRTIPWRLDLARVQAALGNTEAAQELANRQLALARTWGAPGAIGVALRVKALAGPVKDAERALRESISLLAEAGFQAQLAWSRIELGSLLRRAGTRIEAQELLRAGVDAAAKCGANALVERAHEELRVAGARPRRLAFSGVESLTASERRVAEMAASGMTNRQIAQALFVTLKTVEYHLSNAYRKLDVGCRGDLKTALA